MPTAVVDPFGNTIQACSISTAVKAKFGKDKFESEAAWAKHVKTDAWNVLVAKIKGGEFNKNTILARAPGNYKMKYEGTSFSGWHKVSVYTNAKNPEVYFVDHFKNSPEFGLKDWDFGPNMAKLAQSEKLVVNSPTKLDDWLDKHDNEIEIGDTVATVTPKGGSPMSVKYDGYSDVNGKSQFKMQGSYGLELLDVDGLGYYHKSDLYDVKYKVGQTPDVPPAAGLPVSSTSKSVGALTNEDAATLFVKTKDKLAQEAGINIKGASGKLDELVYKTIADQAGYTPAEMLAKVEAYKGSGKKLSALKKKVLPKNGNPTKVVTDTSVNKATAAVKKEEIKPEEVPQVWDEEAVAKAYIKAKDHVVANNNHGWTLYTKNPDFDAEIHKWMQADLGPIKKEVADTAIANYIANTQKLSVLKKQMIKKGELTPQADTLKGKKVAEPGADAVDSPDKLIEYVNNSDSIQIGDTVAKITQYGTEYELKFTSWGSPGNPVFKVGGTTYNKKKIEDLLKDNNVNIDYSPVNKTAPKKTGAGQVGKVGEDPKKIAKELSEETQHEIFLQWEGLNLPISSSGSKLYGEALSLAKKYDLGDDVLPILRAVDAGKTKKFGLEPSQNKKLYEQKVVEHLKNPTPAYTPPSTSGYGSSQVAESYGELPEDSGLFEEVSDSQMHNMALNSMVKPSIEQQSALRSYSGSYYNEINNHLRGGGSMTTRGKQIQDAMSPLPQDIIVKRGTSLKGLGMHDESELKNALGKTFIEPGFSSTAVGGSGQFSGQVNLVIQAPKGTQAVWLKPFSNYSHENELLLKAGTKYKILKVERKPGNWGSMSTVVHVRVIP